VFREAWERGSILSFEETLALTGEVLDGLAEAMASGKDDGASSISSEGSVTGPGRRRAIIQS
jgi:hypothetical protein